MNTSFQSTFPGACNKATLVLYCRAKPKAVTAHFSRKHLLPFGFAEQYSLSTSFCYHCVDRMIGTTVSMILVLVVSRNSPRSSYVYRSDFHVMGLNLKTRAFWIKQMRSFINADIENVICKTVCKKPTEVSLLYELIIYYYYCEELQVSIVRRRNIFKMGLRHVIM